MYEPPIFVSQKKESIGLMFCKELDDYVYKSVIKVGVDVDKEELIRALRYDRDQYDRGYSDGVIDSRKHGRWVGFPECLKYPNAYSDDHIVCSACEECFSVLDNCTERFDYCPNCGATMDLEE